MGQGAVDCGVSAVPTGWWQGGVALTPLTGGVGVGGAGSWARLASGGVERPAGRVTTSSQLLGPWPGGGTSTALLALSVESHFLSPVT